MRVSPERWPTPARWPPLASRCLALARRAPADLPPAGLDQGSTNVCSNQEGFTAGLHMCSNYLHVPGSTWPLARIRSYLAVPSKRRQVHLPRPPVGARPPGDAKQPASRPTEPTCPSVRPTRAGSQAGRTDGHRDGESPSTKIITEAGHPARARGAGGSRPRPQTAVDHRPLTQLNQTIRTIFLADRPYSGRQNQKYLARNQSGKVKGERAFREPDWAEGPASG
jgi:hypothetical protein